MDMFAADRFQKSSWIVYTYWASSDAGVRHSGCRRAAGQGIGSTRQTIFEAPVSGMRAWRQVSTAGEIVTSE